MGYLNQDGQWRVTVHDLEPGYFEHTHLGCYICAILTGLACCVGSYNSQGTWIKIQSAKGYWVLSALLATFTYLYVRPYIRIGIGSASRGYVNFTSIYIVWLISAVFYHLPSLESMGVNIKADVSLMIVVSLGSLMVLSALWLLHILLVQFKLLRPKVSLAAGAWSPEVMTCLLLNSMVLGVMCSTYHSFCGNGLLQGGGISSINTSPNSSSGSGSNALKSAVCAKWLHPILTSRYPWFSSFMLFGEGGVDLEAQLPPDPSLPLLTVEEDNTAGGGGRVRHLLLMENSTDSGDELGRGQRSTTSQIGIDFPWDGIGVVWIPAGNVLSPVLTMWITLIALYIANAVVDQAAATTLKAVHMGELRRSVLDVKNPSLRSIWDRLHDQMQARRAAKGGDLAGPGGGYSANRSPVIRKRRFQRKRPLQFPLLRKTMSKASAVSATAPLAAWGSQVVETLQSPTLQTLLRKTHRIGSVAADLWDKVHDAFDLEEIREEASRGGHRHTWTGEAFGAGSVVSPAQAHCAISRSTDLNAAGSGDGHSVQRSNRGVSGGGEVGGGTRMGSTGRGWVEGAKKSRTGLAGGGPVRGDRVGVKAQSGAKGKVEQAEREARERKGLEPQPAFLPMVPWYSGTSADLYNTCFDLLISVKFFLGRFDMRTLQAATLASEAEQRNSQPHEGDGYLYEHLGSRDSLWLDFIADTGDGGNSTYAVASALAAPQLTVHVPPHFQAAIQNSSLHQQCLKQQPLPQQPHIEHHSDLATVQLKQQQAFSASGPINATSAQAPAAPSPVSSLEALRSEGDAFQGRVEQTLVAEQHTIQMSLPRAGLLLLGGDLAYPNPSRQMYESRLLYPFEEAFPPPAHHHPGRMVIHKPDLPPVSANPEAEGNTSHSAGRHALANYLGPNAFAIPGNHDWIDGLETFTNFIQHKGWLGGWLLPQEKSYFALKLPHQWWIFGVDLALVGDIDVCQLRYFVNVVEQRLTAADDNVLIMTHEPIWLLEWYLQEDHKAANLRQLVRGHLRGRARVHLAGDLHFYMRHSFQPPHKLPPPTPAAAAPAAPARVEPAQQQDLIAERDRPASGAAVKPLGKSTEASEQQAERQASGQGLPKPAQGLSKMWGSTGALAGQGSPFVLPSSQPRPGGGTRVSPNTHTLSQTSAAVTKTGEVAWAKGHRAADTFTHQPPQSTWTQHHLLGNSMPERHVPFLLNTSPPSAIGAGRHLPHQPHTQRHMSPSSSTGSLWQPHPIALNPESSPSHLQAPSKGFLLENRASAEPPQRKPISSSISSRSNSLLLSTVHAPPDVLQQSSSVLGGSSDESDSSSISVGGRSSTVSRKSIRRARSRGPGSMRSAQAKHLLSILMHDLGRCSPSPPRGGSLSPAASSKRLERLITSSNAELCNSCRAQRRELHHTFDPEHLVCQGGGGAFLHPTHIFSPARFAPVEDAAANATAALYSAALQPCTCARSRAHPTNTTTVVTPPPSSFITPTAYNKQALLTNGAASENRGSGWVSRADSGGWSAGPCSPKGPPSGSSPLQPASRVPEAPTCAVASEGTSPTTHTLFGTAPKSSYLQKPAWTPAPCSAVYPSMHNPAATSSAPHNMRSSAVGASPGRHDSMFDLTADASPTNGNIFSAAPAASPTSSGIFSTPVGISPKAHDIFGHAAGGSPSDSATISTLAGGSPNALRRLAGPIVSNTFNIAAGTNPTAPSVFGGLAAGIPVPHSLNTAATSPTHQGAFVSRLAGIRSPTVSGTCGRVECTSPAVSSTFNGEFGASPTPPIALHRPSPDNPSCSLSTSGQAPASPALPGIITALPGIITAASPFSKGPHTYDTMGDSSDGLCTDSAEHVKAANTQQALPTPSASTQPHTHADCNTSNTGPHHPLPAASTKHTHNQQAADTDAPFQEGARPTCLPGTVKDPPPVHHPPVSPNVGSISFGVNKGGKDSLLANVGDYHDNALPVSAVVCGSHDNGGPGLRSVQSQPGGKVEGALEPTVHSNSTGHPPASPSFNVNVQLAATVEDDTHGASHPSESPLPNLAHSSSSPFSSMTLSSECVFPSVNKALSSVASMSGLALQGVSSPGGTIATVALGSLRHWQQQPQQQAGVQKISGFSPSTRPPGRSPPPCNKLADQQPPLSNGCVGQTPLQQPDAAAGVQLGLGLNTVGRHLNEAHATPKLQGGLSRALLRNSSHEQGAESARLVKPPRVHSTSKGGPTQPQQQQCASGSSDHQHQQHQHQQPPRNTSHTTSATQQRSNHSSTDRQAGSAGSSTITGNTVRDKGGCVPSSGALNLNGPVNGAGSGAGGQSVVKGSKSGALSSPAVCPAGVGVDSKEQQQQLQEVFEPADEGLYSCRAAYPTPARSIALGKKNLHLFRLKNTRFDLIGGIWYYLLVVSVMPRCSRQRLGPAPLLFKGLGIDFEGGVAAALDADNIWTAGIAFFGIYMDTLWSIFMESYVSLAMVFAMGLMCFGFARAGGVGAISESLDRLGIFRNAPNGAPLNPVSHQKQQAADKASKGASKGGQKQQQTPDVFMPWICARGGGLPMQLLFAGAHAMAHLSAAVSLMLLLELGVEMCIRHENLGKEGMHSLFRWYREYEQVHFPDPQGLRQVLERATLGLYPGAIKIAMAVFDIPEAIAVTRTAMCAAKGTLTTISRLQALLYYGGMLAYFWLLATPAVGLIFGTYLYLSVCYAGVHYDEAFSSLRVPHYKSLTRMHITSEGDLEVYTLALDKVPTRWREDPGWTPGCTPQLTMASAHHPRAKRLASQSHPSAPYAHDMVNPSRWCPANGAANEGWYLVDYFKVTKQRAL